MAKDSPNAADKVGQNGVVPAGTNTQFSDFLGEITAQVSTSCARTFDLAHPADRETIGHAAKAVLRASGRWDEIPQLDLALKAL
jgi:hypothetical protein